MAGTFFKYGNSAKRVRVVQSHEVISTGFTTLAAGQASGTGAGTAQANFPVYDLWFASRYSSNRSWIPGTYAVIGSKLDFMAKIATQPAEARLLFGDSVEATDYATQFALLAQVADLPPVLVPAGSTWTVVARGVDIGFARFFIPQLVNVGAGASGEYRMCFRIY